MKDIHDNLTPDMFAELIPTTVDDLAQAVYDWAEVTFPSRTDASMYLKLYSEIAEMIRSEDPRLELADLFILLLDYAVRKDIIISEAVLEKLAINRTRKWAISTDGTMSHVE